MRGTFLIGMTSGVIMLMAGLAVAQHHGHDGKHQAGAHMSRGKDARILAQFPPELTEHTLANMRDHLAALEEINQALGLGQTDKAGKVAEERLGMTSLRAHGAHEVAKFMPKGMQEAGSAMHRAASRFAIEAQNSGVSGDLKPALGVLAEVVGACVGCHAGYRLK